MNKKMIYGMRDNLKLIRLLSDESIRNFAELCSVSPQTISNWEKKRSGFNSGNYFQILFPLMKRMVREPKDTDNFIIYILCNYEDKEYEINIKNISIIVSAKKGGAEDKTIKEMMQLFGLDKIKVNQATVTIPNYLGNMISDYLYG